MREKISKTRSRRRVPILDNLRAWLQPIAKLSGPVLVDPDTRYRHEATRARAGIKVWPQNCMRHSFVSYRLAATQNAPQVALESGHDQAILFAHYRELVRPKDAERFFSIRPGRKDVGEKIVSIRPPEDYDIGWLRVTARPCRFFPIGQPRELRVKSLVLLKPPIRKQSSSMKPHTVAIRGTLDWGALPSPFASQSFRSPRGALPQIPRRRLRIVRQKSPQMAPEKPPVDEKALDEAMRIIIGHLDKTIYYSLRRRLTDEALRV